MKRVPLWLDYYVSFFGDEVPRQASYRIQAPSIEYARERAIQLAMDSVKAELELDGRAVRIQNISVNVRPLTNKT